MRNRVPPTHFVQPGWYKKRAGLASGSVVIRFIRLHQGVQKGDATNLGSLSEPRRKQNLYANPKRTAKSKLSYTDQTPSRKKGSNYFQVFPSRDNQSTNRLLTIWLQVLFCAQLEASGLVSTELAARTKEPAGRARKGQSVVRLKVGSRDEMQGVVGLGSSGRPSVLLAGAQSCRPLIFVTAPSGRVTVCLEFEKRIDFNQPINQAVLGDRVVNDRRGIRVRAIIVQNPCAGQVDAGLISEMGAA